MKNLTNRMFLPSPKWARVGQWISGLLFVFLFSFLSLKWCGVFEPANLLSCIVNGYMLIISELMFFAFRLPIEKGQKQNLERLNGTFGQKPRTDGKIDLCCPECFSKDYKKVNNHYECQCGATW